jgi:hypothetical protein
VKVRTQKSSKASYSRAMGVRAPCWRLSTGARYLLAPVQVSREEADRGSHPAAQPLKRLHKNDARPPNVPRSAETTGCADHDLMRTGFLWIGSITTIPTQTASRMNARLCVYLAYTLLSIPDANAQWLSSACFRARCQRRRAARLVSAFDRGQADVPRAQARQGFRALRGLRRRRKPRGANRPSGARARSRSIGQVAVRHGAPTTGRRKGSERTVR